MDFYEILEGPLKVVHLSFSDSMGGAARAAYRIHDSLRNFGVESWMWVVHKGSQDATVLGSRGGFRQVPYVVSRVLVKILKRVFGLGSKPLLSLALFPAGWARKVNESDADVVNLHWVQGEMISVAEIGKIKKPLVWTIHDMWPFCGSEHYSQDYRWQLAYSEASRSGTEKGLDLNRWTWRRKARHWKRPACLVSPSVWLAKSAGESSLMKSWPSTVIPYPIDTAWWGSVTQTVARRKLGFADGVKVLLFGATGGTSDTRKGFDLLYQALLAVRDQHDWDSNGIELVVFGGLNPSTNLELGFPIRFLGSLEDEISLRDLYSAADATLIPSRQDNLPNVGIEAQSCGSPVIAFDVGGLSDIVSHERTGYLAEAFDADDFARGILWLTNLPDKDRRRIRLECRKQAVEKFSYVGVASDYLNLYTRVSLDAQG